VLFCPLAGSGFVNLSGCSRQAAVRRLDSGMGIRFRRCDGHTRRARAVHVPLEEKVAERRERQARSYADGGGSRDHSGDPIVRSDLLPPTGVLKKDCWRNRSGGWYKTRETGGYEKQAGGENKGARKKLAQETGGLKFSIPNLTHCWNPSFTNPTHLLKFAQAFQRMNSNVRILITESDFADQAVY
jgi:hypothetical protein